MLVPYMFQGNQVAMTWVFMKGFSKAAKVVGMTNTGKVQVKVGLSVMEAPPQVAFAQCPSCRREHTQMERYCKGCKESMVYYPLPKTNVRRALEKMNRTKTKKEKKVITTESVTVRSGVTSSCSHYLHEVFEFESKSALKCAEAEVRRVIERSCNSKQLKPPETAYWVDRYNPSDADMGFLRKLDCKSKYSEVPLPEIAAGLQLTLLADAGLRHRARRFAMDRPSMTQRDPVLFTKYLKDAFVNSLYTQQSNVLAPLTEEELEEEKRHETIRKFEVANKVSQA